MSELLVRADDLIRFARVALAENMGNRTLESVERMGQAVEKLHKATMDAFEFTREETRLPLFRRGEIFYGLEVYTKHDVDFDKLGLKISVNLESERGIMKLREYDVVHHRSSDGGIPFKAPDFFEVESKSHFGEESIINLYRDASEVGHANFFELLAFDASVFLAEMEAFKESATGKRRVLYFPLKHKLVFDFDKDFFVRPGPKPRARMDSSVFLMYQLKKRYLKRRINGDEVSLVDFVVDFRDKKDAVYLKFMGTSANRHAQVLVLDPVVLDGLQKAVEGCADRTIYREVNNLPYIQMEMQDLRALVVPVDDSPYINDIYLITSEDEDFGLYVTAGVSWKADGLTADIEDLLNDLKKKTAHEFFKGIIYELAQKYRAGEISGVMLKGERHADLFMEGFPMLSYHLPVMVKTDEGVRCFQPAVEQETEEDISKGVER